MSPRKNKPPMLALSDVVEDRDRFFYVGRLEDLPPNFQEYDSAHRHSYFALFFFEKGEGIHTIDFHEFTIEPNSLFFLKPGQVHSWKFSKPVKGYALKISPEFYSERGENLSSIREFPFFSFAPGLSKIKIEDVSRLNSDFRRLLEEAVSDKDQKMLFALTQVALCQAKKEYVREFDAGTDSGKSAAVVSFQSLLEENFLKERNTTFYSRKIGIAPNTLNRICHETLGKSVKAVIHDRILLEIKRLLLHSNLNITQISYELGFEDNAYFSRYFKAKSGISPEKFRESRTKNTTK
ncbi:AraC family transcriptional regulator [Leptospira yasudae]|uniref:AraC family transcriptional regulator n=1 Tax=Leptospira yasudae TaxID=2202201 RepID=UPI000E5A028A|nr:helix-turn-helix transcriptional regulator [Leptospira yasudae]RHX91282.1 AraC family transcriptional regulator [Leptospira yasudae]